MICHTRNMFVNIRFVVLQTSTVNSDLKTNLYKCSYFPYLSAKNQDSERLSNFSKITHEESGRTVLTVMPCAFTVPLTVLHELLERHGCCLLLSQWNTLGLSREDRGSLSYSFHPLQPYTQAHKLP